MNLKRFFLILTVICISILPLMATGAKEELEKEEVLTQKIEEVAIPLVEEVVVNPSPVFATIDKNDMYSAFNYAYSYNMVSTLLSQGVSINGAYWLRGIDDGMAFLEGNFLIGTADMETAVDEYITSFYNAGLKEGVGEFATQETLDNLPTPETLLDKFSYSYSVMYTVQLYYMNGLDIMAPEFKQGAAEALYSTEPRRMNDDEVYSAIETYANFLDEEYEAYLAEVSETNLAKAEAFLAENKTNEGVVVLESGNLLEVTNEDEVLGATPTKADSVVVDYDLFLLDGTQVDTGTDVTFSLSSLIPGFVEGVTNMKVGQEAYIYIHPDYGYGNTDMGTIPPQSLLIFRVYLKGIENVAN